MKRLGYGGGIDVHDFRCRRHDVLAAAGSQSRRKALPPRETQAAENPLHEWISHDAAQALVAHIVRAEDVAVHEQHGFAVEIDRRTVLQQATAGIAAEVRADEKVAVAVHEVARYAGGGKPAQGGLYRGIGRFRIIVSEPDLEQVAEDVQRLGPAGLTLQEIDELRGDLRRVGVKVQVGDEESRQTSVSGGAAASMLRAAAALGHPGQNRAFDPVRCAPMSSTAVVTRFAPSPSGRLHLGNARTALFNFLAARRGGGRFVLRVEDTDAERSDEAMLLRALDDLRWLGLEWDEGPDVGGASGPYRQSERAETYADALSALERGGFSYPCFCTQQELALSRKTQLASGRPPRYAGTCAHLGAEEVAQRLKAALPAATRFRVAPGRVVEFEDVVHGPQRFSTDDIGDFVIRRADGSAAFFLSNAVDDAGMGINLVLRGDDHLANTPRQILLLEALGLPVPRYGHLPLLLDASGSPLSKRTGSASLHDLRERGVLPAAVVNYLLRLGHVCDTEAWVEVAEAPGHFQLAGASRSPAHYDEAQLLHWQREAVARASVGELAAWMDEPLRRIGDEARRLAFVEAVRGNVLEPADAAHWVDVVEGGPVAVSDEARAEMMQAGSGFFEAARDAWSSAGPGFREWTYRLRRQTDRKGAALFMPLRAALTGSIHGPELSPLVELMGSDTVLSRLEDAIANSRPG